MIKQYTSKLGENRGQKRIYLECQRLKDTEFKPNTSFEYSTKLYRLEIIISKKGHNKISQRRGKPILDLNNQIVTDTFPDIKKVNIILSSTKIIITIHNKELFLRNAKEKVKRGNLNFIDIFCGGGLLTEAFKSAGFNPVIGVEKEDKYLEIYENNNYLVKTYCSEIQDADFKEFDSTLLLASPPCENFSNSGYAKGNLAGKGKGGHLTYWTLSAIEKVQPACIFIEEVPNYQTSTAAHMLRTVLTEMGYYTDEIIIKGSDFGSISKRKRFYLFASIFPGFKFETKKCLPTKTVKDILENSEREWLTEENSATIRTFKRREAGHIAKGDGFRLAGVNHDDTQIPTITKGYSKRRLTDPILQYKDKYSFFTPRELANISGLPQNFKLGNKTISSEIIGQGVSVDVVSELAKQIMDFIKYNMKKKMRAKLMSRGKNERL